MDGVCGAAGRYGARGDDEDVDDEEVGEVVEVVGGGAAPRAEQVVRRHMPPTQRGKGVWRWSR